MDYKLTDNSDKILSEFKMKKERGLKAIGEIAINYAKDDCPVDTGRLRNSIDHAEDENDVYIGTNVEYAPIQEYIHHFLKNAAANHSDEYKNIMKTSMET